MLVAVAEDDPDVVYLLEAVLSDSGYSVATTDNGADALSLVEERRPGVLLLDVRMPGRIDGMEVLRRLRAHDELAALPVVLLTAHAAARDVEAGLAAGADAYLVKPFALEELLSLLERLTSSAR